MKLNLKALAITSAIVWGGSVLGVAIANSVNPRYGRDFLRVLSSIYPGYKFEGSAKDVAVVSLYAAADGAIGGLLTASLYNALSGEHTTAHGLAGSPDMREIA